MQIIKRDIGILNEKLMSRKLIIGTPSLFRKYKKQYPEDDLELVWNSKQLNIIVDENQQPLTYIFQEIVYLGEMSKISNSLLEDPLLIDLESQLDFGKVSRLGGMN
jgi:hypothetical protein